MPRKTCKAFYYAVHKGRKPGVYSDWKTCELQVNKFKGSVCKKFSTRAEAENFVLNGNTSVSSSSSVHKKQGTTPASNKSVLLSNPAHNVQQTTESQESSSAADAGSKINNQVQQTSSTFNKTNLDKKTVLKDLMKHMKNGDKDGFEISLDEFDKTLGDIKCFEEAKEFAYEAIAGAGALCGDLLSGRKKGKRARNKSNHDNQVQQTSSGKTNSSNSLKMKSTFPHNPVFKKVKVDTNVSSLDKNSKHLKGLQEAKNLALAAVERAMAASSGPDSSRGRMKGKNNKRGRKKNTRDNQKASTTSGKKNSSKSL